MVDVLARIKQLRDERGWSDYQLAERSSLPKSTISSWYQKNLVPSPISLEKVCEAFGITLSQFFAESNEPVELTDSQREMLERWSRLTPAQQEAFLHLLDVL